MGADFTGPPSLAARVGTAQQIAFRFYDLYFGNTLPSTGSALDAANLHALPEANPEPAPLASKVPSAGQPLKNYTGVYYHPAFVQGWSDSLI